MSKNFVRFHEIIQMLKMLALYLDKHKFFIPKKYEVYQVSSRDF